MDLGDLDTEVDRLWSFGAEYFCSRIYPTLSRSQWEVIGLARQPSFSEVHLNRAWLPRFTSCGRAWIICEDYGEYNGLLGFWKGDLSEIKDVDEIVVKFRHKHPEWSQKKIERAANDAFNQSIKQRAGFLPALPLIDKFLNDLVFDKPVTLVYERFSSAPVERWAKGELLQRRPVWREPVRFDLKTQSAAELIPIGDWTPVTVFR